METTVFACPNCGAEMKKEEKVLRCANGHSFDLAKEGYVNLLTPDKRHSKEPGDDKEMVRARYDFLEGGYYAPLADKIAEIVQKHENAENQASNLVVLDAGCGSGYYSRVLIEHVPSAKIVGVDIAKEAVRIAAKKCKQIDFAVAGVFALPFADKTFDAVLNVFSPFAFAEYSRVLKDDGILISVYPAAEHLWQLKKMLYDDATFENEKDVKSELFEKTESCTVENEIEVQGTDVKNLLRMTPYYFTTDRAKLEKCEQSEALTTVTAFVVDVLEKKRICTDMKKA